MNNNTSPLTVGCRDKERQRIAQQVDEFLNHGGKIESVQQPHHFNQYAPRKATGKDASMF